MSSCQIVVAAAALLFAVCVSSLSAESNWPRWRGPQENGVAPAGANPPLTWSETSNIQWKVKIPGEGTSTPIVWGDQVFILAAYPANDPQAGPVAAQKGAKTFSPEGTWRFALMSFDRNTGKTRWQKIAREEAPHEGYRPVDGSFASASAITDGEVVLAFFGSRGLHCYDMAGNPKWSKELGKMRTRFGFGEGSTPALHDNTIVVIWDHEDADDYVVAFDKRTGNELWRRPRNEDTTWSTPLIVEHGGKMQVITTATNRIRSYDLATGEQVWEHEGLTTNAIPSPVIKDDIVFAMSGYQGYKLFAIRLGGKGDLTGTDSVIWKLNRGTPYVPSPLLSGERLYFFASNSNILSCHDIRTGKAHYSGQRVEGLGTVYASPVAAAGRVYFVGRDGNAVVIKDSDQHEVLATNKLNDPTDASPAIVGNQIFLRSRQNLYCIAEK